MSTLSRIVVTVSTFDEQTLLARLDRLDARPNAVALRHRTYDLLRLRRGDRVVDVGCGAGLAVMEMAERGATAIGIDTSSQMVATARRRAAGGDFRVADVRSLPLGDGEVTAYRADKVFHELDDPHVALREARRVLAPGGRLVLVGQDWDGLMIDSDNGDLTDTIVRARAGTIVRPRSARAYRASLLDAGFVNVTVEVDTHVVTDVAAVPMLAHMAEIACTTGSVSRMRADSWVAEQAERGRAGRLLVAAPMFVAAADVAKQ